MASNASPLIFDLKFSVEISSLICVFFFSYSVNKPDLLNNYVACQFCSIKMRKLRNNQKMPNFCFRYFLTSYRNICQMFHPHQIHILNVILTKHAKKPLGESKLNCKENTKYLWYIRLLIQNKTVDFLVNYSRLINKKSFKKKDWIGTSPKVYGMPCTEYNETRRSRCTSKAFQLCSWHSIINLNAKQTS